MDFPNFPKKNFKSELYCSTLLLLIESVTLYSKIRSASVVFDVLNRFKRCKYVPSSKFVLHAYRED